MWERDYRKIHKRLFVVAALLVLGVAILTWRAYSIQVALGAKHFEMAQRQTLGSIVIQPRRGDILDRNGQVLATNRAVQSLAAHPRAMSDSEKAMAKRVLPKLFGITPDVLERLDSPRYFVWLKRRLTETQALSYEAVMSGLPKYLRPKSLVLEEEDRRFYPAGGLAAPILGLTDVDSKGQMGLEAQYDEALTGETLEVKGVRDPSGRKVTFEAIDLSLDVPVGDNLQLTLDRRVQYVAEREIAKTVLLHKASYGVAIAMDVKSGDILAMAQYPGYDPNEMEGTKPEAMHNAAVEWTIEPGSTLKTFVVAGALEEGLHVPGDSIFCGNGSLVIGPNVIHDSHPHGYLTVAEVVTKSSNIGTAKIGHELGAQRLWSYLDAFGFGKRTEARFAGESGGILAKPQRWMPIELATISFGQGINVTPLQLTAAFATLANDGEYVPPRLVSRLIAPNGTTRKEFPSGASHRVVSVKTAHMMNEIMQGVVEEGGTGTNARIGGCPIAAKTGTAEKLAKNHKFGVHDFWTSVFAGFFPADDPKIALLIVVDEPKDGKYYGGEVAAPPFRAIASEIAPMLGLCTRRMDEVVEKKKK